MREFYARLPLPSLLILMCGNCKHWQMIDEATRVGLCSLLLTRTEWCARLVERCEQFSAREAFDEIPAPSQSSLVG